MHFLASKLDVGSINLGCKPPAPRIGVWFKNYVLTHTLCKSFFMPAGKSACLCSCQAFLPLLFLVGPFFALLTTDRLSHRKWKRVSVSATNEHGNRNVFPFCHPLKLAMKTEMCFCFFCHPLQLAMETEMCFHFLPATDQLSFVCVKCVLAVDLWCMYLMWQQPAMEP